MLSTVKNDEGRKIFGEFYVYLIRQKDKKSFNFFIKNLW
ncbi:hypothetical protein B4064_3002 [Caldibacillus thermoamylovorans]|uniref:Uncharacterized protein n=1 Tax=Caldibacillus thermoamylovorans TaxID=35841 RepID=A0A0D0F7Y6_9BACI|nr:hypothetical protein B4166_3590 [Caldibacillus thermoamylovorans]KIO62314.1 hypothetical protein B4065_3243 [Caldibacillus thermoamylovorans]KIO63784.1 hypothetical protein B4064_3002 [Caldibacillus thermoamylovorans]KIO73830.1 hypothetical protein B4167_1777 [Caldibacillus thermoamylovorans]